MQSIVKVDMVLDELAFQKMSRNEVTHKLRSFLHYVWNIHFAGVQKTGIHRKKIVLESFLIKTAGLEFATALKKTPAKVLSSEL